MGVLNIIYQFNEHYAPYAGVSMTSLFENNRKAEEINIYILGEDLSQESKSKFKELGKVYGRNIVLKDTETIIYQMKEWGIPSYRGSYAANLRLFLPFVLEEDLERLLYLDADTIVAGDIQEFVQSDLHGCAIGMVKDSFGDEYKWKIGLHQLDSYYNSGVVLYDYRAWKENDFSRKIIDHILEGNTRYASPDQDLLNVTCKGKIHTLSLRYNLQPAHLVYSAKTYLKCYGVKGYYSKEEIEESVRQPVIYHFFRFLGEFPWDKNNMHPDRKIFDYYLEISLWKDYKKEKSSANLFMKTEKIMYLIFPKAVFLRIFKYMHSLYLNKSMEISDV